MATRQKIYEIVKDLKEVMGDPEGIFHFPIDWTQWVFETYGNAGNAFLSLYTVSLETDTICCPQLPQTKAAIEEVYSFLYEGEGGAYCIPVNHGEYQAGYYPCDIEFEEYIYL